MSTTIHSLSYKVLMDTKDFTEGSVLTRKELNASKKAMRDAKTPAEQLEDEYKKLAKMAKAGAIDQRAYNAEVEKAEKRFLDAEKSNSKWNTTLGKMKPLAVGATAALGGLVAAGVALTGKVKSLNQDFLEFERFGLNASESLGTFRVIAMETGLEVSDLADLTKDLSVRIGEASLEGGEAAEAFDRLGFDVQEFINKSPEEKLRGFADSISKVKSETIALTEADKLLSDAGTDVIQFLRKGEEAFDNAAIKANALNQNVSAMDVASVKQANEAMMSIDASMSAFTSLLAIRTAPLIEEIAGNLTVAMGGAGGSGSTTGNGMLGDAYNYVEAARLTGAKGLTNIVHGMSGAEHMMESNGFFKNLRNLEMENYVRQQSQMSSKMIEQQRRTNEILANRQPLQADRD